LTTELDALREYICSEMGYAGAIDPEVDLLEAKILDSFSIVQMAMFLQEHFNIELEPEDLVRENLAKLSSMIALVERRRAAIRS
jgi:acyl carrier protein